MLRKDVAEGCCALDRGQAKWVGGNLHPRSDSFLMSRAGRTAAIAARNAGSVRPERTLPTETPTRHATLPRYHSVARTPCRKASTDCQGRDHTRSRLLTRDQIGRGSSPWPTRRQSRARMRSLHRSSHRPRSARGVASLSQTRDPPDSPSTLLARSCGSVR